MSAQKFHAKMVNYLDEYQQYLLFIKSDCTAAAHVDIVHRFINYLYNHYLISSVYQITVSIANSKFLADYNRKNKAQVPKEMMKDILNGFFVFVYGKHGIKNEKLMKGFHVKTSKDLV